MLAHPITASIAGIAAAILCFLAVAHMYWALGGSVAATILIPEAKTRRGGKPKPPAVTYLLTSLSLVLASDLMLVRLGLLTSKIPPWGMEVACGALALAFLARAVGDFGRVGFFKKVRDSRFARLDTAVFSPLCLFLAVALALNV